MKRAAKRQRELVENDFLRNHAECSGKKCKNCQESFKNIFAFNNHINMCNFIFKLQPQQSEIEEDADFNLKNMTKFLARKSDFIKNIQRDLQIAKTMCWNCCKNDCQSDCVALLCVSCGHRYNLLLFVDHLTQCKKVNRNSSFYYFELGKEIEKSEVIKTKELIQQLELLSLSSSSESGPTKPKIRLTLRKMSAKSRTSKPVNSPELNSEPRVDDKEQASSSSDDGEILSGGQKVESEYEANSDPSVSDEYDMKEPRPWAAYKRRSRENTNYAKNIKESIDKIPSNHRSGALIKNHLVDLNLIKSNFQEFHPNEFLKRQIHFLLIDRNWTENEQAAYMNFFNLKKSFLNEILSLNTLSHMTHRTSFKQQYRNDEISLILEYILANSAPSADHSHTISRKKIDKVQNRVKQSFYR